jgi:hypothetical protein
MNGDSAENATTSCGELLLKYSWGECALLAGADDYDAFTLGFFLH